MKTVSTKSLRNDLKRFLERAQKGEHILVMYRNRPMCRLVPIEPSDNPVRLEEDSLYRAPAVGQSTDGMTSTDHDAILYR